MSNTGSAFVMSEEARAMGLLNTSVRRHLRYLFWGWTFIGSVGATAGAIYGWMQVDNDSGS